MIRKEYIKKIDLGHDVGSIEKKKINKKKEQRTHESKKKKLERGCYSMSGVTQYGATTQERARERTI